MPRGHERDLIYSLSIYMHFLAQFSLKGKPVVVPCFDVMMITLFRRNKQESFCLRERHA